MNTSAQIPTPAFWNTPRPDVLSGFDQRSSDAGLLTLFFGSLAHASQHQWLNAGRTLIDKTYIQMLWEAKKLSFDGLTSHDIANALDTFIRSEIVPVWDTLHDLDTQAQNALAITLLERAASSLFGQQTRARPASWLLFYLLPQLPVMPLIQQEHASYLQHHIQMRALFAQQLPYLMQHCPTPDYGTDRQKAALKQAIQATDWWQRLCFIEANCS